MDIYGTIKQDRSGGHIFTIPAFDCRSSCEPNEKPELWIRSWVEAAVFAESKCKIKVKITRLSKTSFVVSSAENKFILGLILAAQRRKKNMSLRELANSAGLKSHAAVLRYEQGQNEMSLSQFEKFLSKMGLNLKIDVT